jgi:hypothetical protein
MIYHGQVTGPEGQLYQCEHNHRTETAAIRCANSSATHQMAALAWQRAADQAAREAELAKQRAKEREAAQARRIAAQAAVEQANAAKRAAKLATMTPRRAWKLMTPVERLLRTADLEMQVYGEIRTPDALAAYKARAAKPPTPKVPAPSKSAPPETSVPLRAEVAVGKPVRRESDALALISGLSGLGGIASGITAAVVHASAHGPVCDPLTSPMSCFQAQVNAQNAGMPELAIAAVLFIIAAIAGFAAKASAKDAEKK